ncbi:hypothetical protein ACQI5H_23805 [Mycobacterium heidelbergense]|uniref:hypothetical protein n=1 Tax=Mycobacterium heidelbergense TaxID=53376 RepID=UPI003CF5B72B
MDSEIQNACMRFVKIERTNTGYSLDPTGYMDRLPELAPQLPPGAARFVTDSDHYDFVGDRCVKDLKLVSMGLSPKNDQLAITARFEWNQIAPVGLTITYQEVTQLNVASHHFGPVQLDETLPHERGCRHEIQLIGGSIVVVWAEFDAVWEPAP